MSANDALTILSVAFPFAPVSPDAVGGAEQILSQIDIALARAGHRSIVIACEGSKPEGQLIATRPVIGPIDDSSRTLVHQQYREAIDRAIQQHTPDIIHFHGVDCHAYLPETAIPSLLTLHCPVHFYEPQLLHSYHPNLFIHCVSASQRRSCPPGIRLLPDIPNGVAQRSSDRLQAKGDFVIALGRICPEKNFHMAIDAAKAANSPLILAGMTYRYPAHESYFKTEIRPRLDGKRRYIGPIAGERKWNLLSSARCLLIPSLVQETSSLVAMEALACGTPVIAFPSGALPEIVEHTITGFLVRDMSEMVEAIEMVGTISPETCREVASSRFSVDRMTAQYMDLYRRLASVGHSVQPANP